MARSKPALNAGQTAKIAARIAAIKATLTTVSSWIMSGRWNYVGVMPSCRLLFPVCLSNTERRTWKSKHDWTMDLLQLTRANNLKHITGYAMDGFTCVDSEEEAKRIGEELGEVQD